jgi:hypothetical protein
MNVIRKIRTHDAPVHMSRARAIDTVLTAASDAELAAYFAGRAKPDLGKLWTGVFEPMLDALPAEVRDELIEKVERYKAPSEEFRVDGNGTLASKGTSDSVANASLRQWRDSTGRQIEAINRAHEKFWNERQR